MSSEIINPSQSQLRSLLPVSRPSVAKWSRSSKSETLIGSEKYHTSIWKIASLVATLSSSSAACSFDKSACSTTYFFRNPRLRGHKLWGEPGKQPDQIVRDKNLSIAILARADPNCRDTDRISDLLRDVGDNNFQHHRECASFFYCTGVDQQRVDLRLRAALDPVEIGRASCRERVELSGGGASR